MSKKKSGFKKENIDPAVPRVQMLNQGIHARIIGLDLKSRHVETGTEDFYRHMADLGPASYQHAQLRQAGFNDEKWADVFDQIVERGS